MMIITMMRMIMKSKPGPVLAPQPTPNDDQDDDEVDDNDDVDDSDGEEDDQDDEGG